MTPRRRPGRYGRGMLAQFLHFYPQYTLRDLRDGTLTIPEFRLLYTGMLDVEHPDMTEPLEEQATRLTREAHVTSGKRSEW